jgi:thiamine-monophosphate kinase
MATLRDIGEFGLIERVTRALRRSPGVVEGVGDDCAVLRFGNALLLATCDASIEHIHFCRDWAAPHDIGWKAAAGAISDIAAMGGDVRYVLSSVACPADSDSAVIEQICAGIVDAVESCGAVLVGGDMTASQAIIGIDISVLGEAVDGRYLTRAGALSGDAVAVTGFPGLAAAGLLALQRGIDAAPLIQAHLRPVPRLAEGRWLLARAGVHAMIDLSDGLLQDLGHIAERSRVGINVDSDLVPLGPALNGFDSILCEPLECLALSGGEDYELAIALDPALAPAICRDFAAAFDRPLTVVGEVSSDWQGIRLDGQEPGRRGFDHFGPA